MARVTGVRHHGLRSEEGSPVFVWQLTSVYCHKISDRLLPQAEPTRSICPRVATSCGTKDQPRRALCLRRRATFEPRLKIRRTHSKLSAKKLEAAGVEEKGDRVVVVSQSRLGRKSYEVQYAVGKLIEDGAEVEVLEDTESTMTSMTSVRTSISPFGL